MPCSKTDMLLVYQLEVCDSLLAMWASREAEEDLGRKDSAAW